MSSPNEPGYPRAGDSPGANGSVTGPLSAGSPTGHAADSGDAPPWQRGPATRAARPHVRQPQESPARTEAPRGGSAAGHSPNDTAGLDARLNRFIAGGSASPAPTHEADSAPRAERTEAPRTERTEAPRSEAPRTERTEAPRTERTEAPRVERTEAPRVERTEAPRVERPEPPRPEAYASELPDLSGPTPRPAQQRKPVPERAAQESSSRPTAATSRIQVGTRHKGPVRASMQIRRVDPWSALKVSLVLSVALFFVWMIAVAFLYLVLGGMGVWSKLNSNVGDLLTSASGQTGGELVSSGTIFGGAALIGLVNIVLLTAMATVGAFIYNLTTDLVGGVEVTLADRE